MHDLSSVVWGHAPPYLGGGGGGGGWTPKKDNSVQSRSIFTLVWSTSTMTVT